MKHARKIQSQDQIVANYIKALEINHIKAAEIFKKDIAHFYGHTDFSFTVPETIAMYAYLANKQKAYKYILQHDLFPKFHLPAEKIMLLCALKHGFVGMLDILIAKDKKYFEVIKFELHRYYNAASVRHIIKKNPAVITYYRPLSGRAIDDNDTEMLDLILRLCDKNDPGQCKPTYYAGRSGNLEMLKHCLSHVNDIDSWKLLPQINDFTSNPDILKFFHKHNKDTFKHYINKTLCNAIQMSHLESIKYLVSIGAQIEDASELLQLPEYFCTAESSTVIKVLIFCEQHLKLKFDKFSLLINAISYKRTELVKHIMSGETPLKLSECTNIRPAILRALSESSLEILEYLISQGLDLQTEEKKYIVTQWWDRFNDFEFIKRISTEFDINNSEMLAYNVTSILCRSDVIEIINYYHSIGCNELCNTHAFSTAINQKRYDIADYIASIQKDEIAQYISSVNVDSSANKGYQEYCEVKKSLLQNVSPAVMIVPFDTSIMPIMANAPKIQRGMFVVYEMMYCAIEYPIEVLYLIAKQILGFELNAQILAQYQFLTQLNIPREIEVMHYDRHPDYKQRIWLKLLYLEHNQIEPAKTQ